MKRPTRASRQLALALDGEAVAELRQQPAQDVRDEVVKVLAELLLEAMHPLFNYMHVGYYICRRDGIARRNQEDKPISQNDSNGINNLQER
jgi:hypothetical protein